METQTINEEIGRFLPQSERPSTSQKHERQNLQNSAEVWKRWTVDLSDPIPNLSIGNRGAHISAAGTFHYSLLSSFPINENPTIYNNTDTGLLANNNSKTCAVWESDRHYSYAAWSTVDSGTLYQPVLRAFRSGSDVPLWQDVQPLFVFQLEYTDVFCSGNGDRVVTVARGTGGTSVSVYSSESESPPLRFILSTHGAAQDAAMSDDGTTIVIQDFTGFKIFDLSTGTLLASLYQTPSPGPDVLDISSDGSQVALASNSAIHIYRRDAGGYSLQFTHSLVSGGIPVGLRMSADFDRAAVAYRRLDNNSVGVVSLSVPDGTETNEWSVGDTEASDFVLSSFDASKNLRTVAAGYRTISAQTPELVLLVDNQEAMRFELAQGGAHQVDVSVDGTLALAASRNGNPATASRLDLFSTGIKDMDLQALPFSNSTVTIDYEAEPGTTCALLHSAYHSSFPRDFGPIGELFIDEQNYEATHTSIADESGLCSFDVLLDNSLYSPNGTHHFQGLSLAPRKLSSSALTFTILPEISE